MITIAFSLSLFIYTAKGQLVINEVSQGSTGTSQEYVELVVTGTPDCDGIPNVDLRGWIIDDNNGFHSTSGSGSGVAQGCVRFADDPLWSAVPIGTLILVYNNADKNPLIPGDDLSLTDGNCILVVPISSALFESHATEPNTTSTVYPNSGFTTGGSWSVVAMANTSDSYQTIAPADQGSSYHAVSWGAANDQNQVIYFSSAAGGSVFYMSNSSDNNISNQANWVSAAVAGNETPGLPNNVANAEWLSSMNNNCQPFAPLSASISVSNNACNGQQQGSAVVSADDGYPSYTYVWSTPDGNGQSANNLPEGNYSVTITDSLNCDTTILFSLTDPAQLSVTSNITDTSICRGSTIALTASGASGYTWSPATGLNTTTGATVSAKPDSSITYTLIGSNASNCKDTSYINFVVYQPPTVIITPSSSTICLGTNVTLTAEGASQYNWFPATGLSSSSLPVVVAAPVITTNYLVLGIDTLGCTNSASASVSVVLSPILNITASSNSICQGDTMTLSATGASAFSWSPATGLNQTTGAVVKASPASTTTYTITGTTGINCTSFIDYTVIVDTVPDVSASPISSALCAGDSVALNASGANDYAWSPAMGLNQSSGSSVMAFPNQTTNYTVTGSNGNCMDTAQVQVEVLPLLSLTIISNDICAGDSVNIFVSGATSYSWLPSDDLNTITGDSIWAKPGSTNTYTLFATDINNCIHDTTVTIAVYDYPELSFTISSDIICEGDTVSAKASGADSYNWPAGSISITSDSVLLFPDTTETILLTGSNSFGCTSDTSFTITVNPAPDLNITSSKPFLCLGDTLTVSASGAFNHSWQPADSIILSSGNVITTSPSASTLFTVSGTGANNCTSTDTFTVLVYPKPQAIITAPDSVCKGVPFELTGSGGDLYQWSPDQWLNAADKDSVICTLLDSISYQLTVYNTQGCSDSSDVSIKLFPDLSLKYSNLINSCKGDSTLVIINDSGGRAPFTYSWSPIQGVSDPTILNPYITAIGSTTYFFTVTDFCNKPITGAINLNLLPSPFVNITSDKINGCAPGEITFFNATGSNTQISNWNIVEGPSFTGNPSTWYFGESGVYELTLAVTDTITGCKDSSSVPYQVILYPKPEAVFSMDPITGTENWDRITFTSFNFPPQTLSWHWDFGNTDTANGQSTIYMFPTGGTWPVTLTILDENLCEDDTTIYIYIKPDSDIFIPNTFTPNNDNLNDIFEPKGFGIATYELFIFERWGQLIYQSSNKGWDGRTSKSNDISQEDVYVYRLVVNYFDGTQKVYLGPINLLK